MRQTSLLGLALTIVVGGCSREKALAADRPSGPVLPVVSEQGTVVTFPVGAPGLARLETAPVNRGGLTVRMVAPARVVASIAPVAGGREPVVLFDSPDVASTWSQYRQARVAVERTATALGRVRDMYENLGATARDLTDAETEAATARAALTEHEAHLRAVGFDPAALDRVSGSAAWLVSDIPEADLHEIERGGQVSVTLSSAPDRPVVGRAEAIGDVVDPVTRTVKARITVPNQDHRVLPGMFARVQFGTPRRSVIAVPADAIVTVEEQAYLFVRTSPTEFRRRAVTLQRANAEEAIVLAGLSEGEEVVTKGSMLLKGLSFGY